MARITRGEGASAATRAVQGFTLSGGNPLGALAGFGVGLLEGVFGEDEFETRERRKRELSEQIRRLKTEAIQRFQADVSKQTAGAVGGARQAAARRAAAMGREENVESIIAPLEQNIFSQASRLRSGGLREIEDRFANIEAQIESDYAGRPIEPSIGDAMTELGQGVIGYQAAEKAAKAQSDFQNRWLDILKQDVESRAKMFQPTPPSSEPSPSSGAVDGSTLNNAFDVRTLAHAPTNTSLGHLSYIPADYFDFAVPTPRQNNRLLPFNPYVNK